MTDKPEKQLNIELSEEMAEGTYANLSIITHSSSEFIFDFVRMMPNAPKAKVKSRVVMNAENAKRFLAALQENVARYEEQFGKLENGREGDYQFPFQLTGVKGDA